MTSTWWICFFFCFFLYLFDYMFTAELLTTMCTGVLCLVCFLSCGWSHYKHIWRKVRCLMNTCLCFAFLLLCVWLSHTAAYWTEPPTFSLQGEAEKGLQWVYFQMFVHVHGYIMPAGRWMHLLNTLFFLIRIERVGLLPGSVLSILFNDLFRCERWYLSQSCVCVTVSF